MPRCPVCSHSIDMSTVATPPFCSERCRVIDLGRWLDGAYSVPVVGRGDDDEGDGEGGISPQRSQGDGEDE